MKTSTTHRLLNHLQEAVLEGNKGGETMRVKVRSV